MNKTTKTIILIVLILLIGWAIYAASNSEEAIEDGTTIKVGFIGAITGEFGMTGQNYIRGLSLAEQDLERQHEGLNIDLVVEDDEFDSATALTAYNKLKNVDQIDALVNETTPAIEAFYDDVVSWGIPVLQGGEQIRSPEADNVFLIQPGFYTEGVASGLVDHLKEQGIENPAILVTEHPILTERFMPRIEAAFGESIYNEVVAQDASDVRTPITKILNQEPDAIIVLMFPGQGAQAVRTIKEVDDNHPQLVFDAMLQSGFATYEEALSDTTILDGSIVIAVDEYQNDEFQESYVQEHGEEPGIGSAYGYDALTLLVQTYAENDMEWVENIEDTTAFQGVSGEINFDENGVRIPSYSITAIENGEIQTAE